MGREGATTPRLSVWERFPKLREILPSGFPQHVLIIPDGNRRWAIAHKLEAVLGHRSGMQTTLDLMRDLDELPIRMVTFWTFSSENWQRPKEETDAMMAMLERGIKENLPELQQRKIRLQHLGRTDRIPQSFAKTLKYAAEATSQNTGTVVNLAIDFGGDDQELRMAQQLLDLARAKPDLGEVTPELWFSLRDQNGKVPPADLLIRTSGEKRTSGIGWLNNSPTELDFRDELYPDIGSEIIVDAIVRFSQRQRRMGA